MSEKKIRSRAKPSDYVFTMLSVILLLTVESWGSVVSLSGYVRKQSDSTAIANADVTAYQQNSTTVITSDDTNASGHYQLNNLPASTTVTVTYVKSGFQTKTMNVTLPTSDVTYDVNLFDEYDDPPSASDYQKSEQKMKIYFSKNGSYYEGRQGNSMCKIYCNNSNFDPNHACSDFDKAQDGQPNKEDYRVDHLHHRYDYGSGPGDPCWGSGGSLPAWPDPCDGEAFWNWAYEGVDGVTGGSSPTMERNCVSYAFDGLNGGDIKVITWVDSLDNPGNQNIDKLWSELTNVYSFGSDYEDEHIYDGDIAGNDLHVWVLHDPDGGNGNGPAEEIKWKNNGSGEYTWSHSSEAGNCGLKAALSTSSTVVTNWLYRKSVANPLFDKARIKRDP